MRWDDGELTAEPLVEVLVDMLIRSQHVVRPESGVEPFEATLATPQSAALTILEALYEVGAHIIRWEGLPRGMDE